MERERRRELHASFNHTRNHDSFLHEVGARPAGSGLSGIVIDSAPAAAIVRSLASIGDIHPLDAVLTDPELDVDSYVQSLNEKLRLSVRQTPGWNDMESDPAAAMAALRAGVTRHPESGDIFVVPRAATLKALVRVLKSHVDLRDRVRLVTPQALADTVLQAGGRALGPVISRGPAALEQAFTAAGLGRVKFAGLLLICLVIASAVAAISGYGWAQIPFALAFFALTAVRLWTLAVFDSSEPIRLPLADAQLPVYTVLVPLYREAKALPGLVEALCALNYPAAKLDIKLLVEEDDTETRMALAFMALPGCFERLDVPRGQPRTKPRALNLGLAAARGSICVIYDAEDRPEPEQLRLAAACFAANGVDLACAQARLTIDNTNDNWITRAFTIEYAGLFEVFLPALARKGRMIPLGGTSNHFRTEVLRAIGGWDAWNVTEDADLGVRLARLGYRTAMILSRTYEEAPNNTIAWLKQRTRWLKGYVVTWCVHMRQPVRLWRELGAWDFMIFHVVIGGVPLAALAQTVCLAVLGWQLATDTLFQSASVVGVAIAGLQAANLILGYSAAAAIAWIGLERQDMRRLTPSLWLLVPYWLMVAAAGYRALVQLATTPFSWEKTTHGVARTSRLAWPGSPKLPGASRLKAVRGCRWPDRTRSSAC